MSAIQHQQHLNNTTVYQGDCLEVMDDLISQDIKVDAIITDPPYGTTECKWDTVIPFDEMWLRLNKLIKSNGAIVLFGSETFSSYLRMSNIKNYKYDWYWKKSNITGFQHAKNMPLRELEMISIFSTGVINHESLTDKRMAYCPQGVVSKGIKKVGKKPVYMGQRPNQEGKEYEAKGNYPRHLIEFKNDSNTLHPTQKPVALMEYLIKTYTNEGELVLDFTMGSGSTGVACVNTNRNFIGIELDRQYHAIACERVEKAKGNWGLFS